MDVEENNIVQRMQEHRRFVCEGMAFVKAAVVAAAICQVLGSVGANRPPGTHPGHAYFEQPCCGHSHLRHHKGLSKFEAIFYFKSQTLR